VIPILMYHQVAGNGPAAYGDYTVRPHSFARQMRMLATLGYKTVSLERVMAARMSGLPLPKRSLVITFDDGFADAIQNAVPVLVRHGLTATFFIVAGLIGRTSEWTRRKRGIEMALADAAALRDVAAAGFTIGSHTVTHRRLGDLQQHEIRYELEESKRRLEDALGRAVCDLAYPYGSMNENVREAAAECGYRDACSTIEGLSAATDDPFMLRRVHIHGRDSLPDFVCRVRTGYALRNMVHRVRTTMKVSDLFR
jgi:peptidoglycan/xylan/chitin deacetylase (PgdA/CDA1 family)